MWGIVSERYRLALPKSLPVLVLIYLSASCVSLSASFNETSSQLFNDNSSQFFNESSSEFSHEPYVEYFNDRSREYFTTSLNGSWLGKCCPPGQIFLMESEFECMTASDRATELHAMSRDPRSRINGIPRCDDSENMTMTPFDSIKSADYLTSPSCLEVERNATSGEDLLVVAHCRPSENDTGVTLGRSSFPKMVTVRKCCPKNTVFSFEVRSCIKIPNTENDSTFDVEDRFVSLLPKTESLEFVATSRGPPSCSGVIFDYVIDARDLRFGIPALKMNVSLSQNGWQKEEIELTEENVCLDLTQDSLRKNDEKLVLRLCQKKEVCSEKSCVPKCCRENQYRASRIGCKNFNESVTRYKFHKMMRDFMAQNFDAKDYGLMANNPCEHGSYVSDLFKPWAIIPPGYLKVSNFEIYKYGDYCMDIFYNGTDFVESVVPFICFDKPVIEDSECTLRCQIRITLQSISCVFFLMTLVVYGCLPVLRNLHGKTLMCHVASLLTAYASLVLSTALTAIANANMNTILCTSLGYTMLFAFVSAFGWLNVMCFDIWWTFGGLRENISTRSRRHKKRFLFYNLYSWGLGALITGLAIMFDNTDILSIYLQPRIGQGSCWFTHGKYLYGEVLFFIGPLTLQLAINVIFFVMTSIHCNKVKAEINRLTIDSSDARNRRFQASQTKFVINIRLFVVMGVSWTMEVISYFVETYVVNLEWRQQVFYLSDALNSLQGVFIFFQFVAKRRVYHALLKRFGLMDGSQGSSNGTTIHDPSRMRKSVSNSTIMSTFQVSSTP